MRFKSGQKHSQPSNPHGLPRSGYTYEPIRRIRRVRRGCSAEFKYPRRYLPIAAEGEDRHMVTKSSDSDYNLLVPADILNKIPDDIKNDPDRLRGHLVRALKIGLLAIEGGEFTLSTERIENAIESTVTKYQDFDAAFEESLSRLIDQKLTGDESQLANRLSAVFGERGDLRTRLDAIFDDISNPDKASSVPNRVTEVMDTKFQNVETEITSALDVAKEDSPLRSFLNEQRTNFNQLKTDMETEMGRIQTALNVDEILQAKEDEIADLYSKSSGKGIHFENDSVDALQDIAGLFGDRIEHTGGEGVGKSRTKIGDVVIVIISPGVPEIRIAIEAKSGSSIGRKELVRQTRDGVKMRGAVCGIGLMERKHMGVRQQVVEQEGENFIVGVDWDNQDFLALEVVYRTLRAQLIAEEIRSSGEDGIDVNSLKKHLTQAKTDLGLLQGLKGGARSAITTLEDLRNNLDLIEDKVKEQLSKAEDLL